MNAEDPLFILYTSGSTGKPKGVCTRPAAMPSGRRRPSTGSSIIGRTNLLVHRRYRLDHRPQLCGLRPAGDGRDQCHVRRRSELSDFGRFWETVDRLGVTIFYTAPTRSVPSMRRRRRLGDPPQPQVAAAARHGRRADQSRAWEWYWRVVGDGRCPIVDTWWQTETGGAMISPVPGAVPASPVGDQAAARRLCRAGRWRRANARGRDQGNLC